MTTERADAGVSTYAIYVRQSYHRVAGADVSAEATGRSGRR